VRRILRQILLLFLCVSLTPGWGEVLENLEHLVRDGHPAHVASHEGDEDHAAHEALEAEHGCTPVSHICGCHASVPVLVPDGIGLPQPRLIVCQRVKPWGIDETIAYRAQAPPVPPPRA
jgi:hypothetical protein